MEEISKRLVEVECILKRLEKEYLEKIPSEIWDFIRNNKSLDYTYKYDETKELEQQNLHIDTIAILTYINMEYLLNDRQKNDVEEILKKDEAIADEEKRKLYNSDNIFKDTIKTKKRETIPENNLLTAYAEVDKILSYMETKFVEKVPKKLRDTFKNEKLKDYEPKIDKNLPLEQQKLQRKTLAILALLNINYWCESEEEKQELLKIYAQNDRIREKQLRERYNPDNIFSNKKGIQEETENVTRLVKYKKENFIKKLLNKIRKLFRK